MADADGPKLPVAVGDIVDGKYCVVQLLAVGGMGVVMAATHLELGHAVALKFMKRGAAQNARLVARFLREARAASRLRGEHVARVTDVGRLPQGIPYMVMEHLVGDDLSTVLAAGPLQVPAAIEYLLQACEAISEAHTLGIIHRDIKPANLFITRTPNGKPSLKVLDFGISKLAEDDSVGEHVTATRVMLGTPHFMAPEQMRSARRADERSDVYALGAVLYRMLCERPPFHSDSLNELTAMVLRDPPPRLADMRPDVPRELDRIVSRCLEKDAAARFPTVMTLAEALQAVKVQRLESHPAPTASLPVIAPPRETAEMPSPPPRPTPVPRSLPHAPTMVSPRDTDDAQLAMGATGARSSAPPANRSGVVVLAAVVAVSAAVAIAVWTTRDDSAVASPPPPTTQAAAAPPPSPENSEQVAPTPAPSLKPVTAATPAASPLLRPVVVPRTPRPPTPSPAPAPTRPPIRDFGDRE